MPYSSKLLPSARYFFKYILVFVTLWWLVWIWIFRNPGNIINLKMSTTGQLLPQHLFFLNIHYLHTTLLVSYRPGCRQFVICIRSPEGQKQKHESVFTLSQAVSLKAWAKILKLAYTRSEIIAIIAINSSYLTFRILSRSIYMQKYVVCTSQIGWHWKLLYLAWIREALKNGIKNKNRSTRLPHLALIMHLFHLHIQDSLHGHKYFLSMKILIHHNF